MSLDEAIEEQKEILEKINDLEKNLRPDKIGRSLWKDKKDKADKLIENAKELYKTRGDIINAFTKLETEVKEAKDEETEAKINRVLPPWVEVSKERFDKIKDTINKAVKDKLQVKLLGNNIISMTK